MSLALDVEPIAVITGIGVPFRKIIEADGLARLLVSHEMDGASLKQLDDHEIADLAALWPNWSEVTVQTDQLIEVDFLGEDAAEQLANLNPNRRYELRIFVDKSAAIEETFPGEQCVWFVTGEAAARRLDRGVAALDDWLFEVPDKPARLLISDTNVRLTGPRLSVAGGQFLLEPPAPSGDASRAIERMDSIAVDTARWSGPYEPGVTPAHLTVTGTGWESDVGRQLLRNLAALTLLYTADRARATDDRAIRAQFFGRDRLVIVKGPPSLDELRQPADTAKALEELLKWCYDEEPDNSQRAWVSERLQLLQVAVVDLLYAVEPSRRTQAFVASLPDLIMTARSSWKAFLADSLSAHTREVAKLVEAVDAATHQFTARVAEISKSMIESMLAAVAVVVGSLIASTVSDDFNANVFQIGMYMYAAYLVAFPGIAGLWNQHARFQTANASFRRRRERFIDALGEELTERTEGRAVDDARERFWWAFGAAAILYVVVALALVWGAQVVPEMVARG